MEKGDLIARYPQLFHMAAAGSWETIERFGLLTTEEIVLSSGLQESEEYAILQERRPDSVRIDHPALGQVAIRDQGPLKLHNLHLEDVTLEQWLTILNNRVFFWLHPSRLDTLLGAVRYRDREQDVIFVDTASLVRDYEHRIFLSALNSGATIYPSAPARGTKTFQSIETYDFTSWRKKRSSDLAAIVELAVAGGVPNLKDYVIRVERRVGSVLQEVLHEA